MQREFVRRNIDFTLENERYFSLRKRGILFLDDEIDGGAFSKICRDIIYLGTGGSVLDKFLELDPEEEKKKPLWIVLCSVGGSVLYGFGIHDCIKMVVNWGRGVNILAVGFAASMASVILQAGTRRLALPNTQFLIHQASESIFSFKEEVNQLREKAQELERINRKTMEIIAKRSGVNLEDILAMTNKTDVWLDCERARQLGSKGLIDEVIDIFPF